MLHTGPLKPKLKDLVASQYPSPLKSRRRVCCGSEAGIKHVRSSLEARIWSLTSSPRTNTANFICWNTQSSGGASLVQTGVPEYTETSTCDSRCVTAHRCFDTCVPEGGVVTRSAEWRHPTANYSLSPWRHGGVRAGQTEHKLKLGWLPHGCMSSYRLHACLPRLMIQAVKSLREINKRC